MIHDFMENRRYLEELKGQAERINDDDSNISAQ